MLLCTVSKSGIEPAPIGHFQLYYCDASDCGGCPTKTGQPLDSLRAVEQELKKMFPAQRASTIIIDDNGEIIDITLH